METEKKELQEEKKIETITLKDLIAMKLEKDKRKDKIFSIYIESRKKNMNFKKPSENILLDVLDLFAKENSSDVYEGLKFLIYNSCSIFQSIKAREELEAVDPLDSVSNVFELSEITSIGERLCKEFGLREKVENIKN